MQRLEDQNLGVIQRLVFKNQNERSSLEDFYWSPADRLKLRLYENQLSSRWHGDVCGKRSRLGYQVRPKQLQGTAGSLHPTQLYSWTDTTQWGTAARHPLTQHHASTLLLLSQHTRQWTKEKRVIFTVNSDAGLWLVILARHLPDVEGLGGRVRQEAEHQDDSVGVGKTVRVDLSVHETKTDDRSDLL